MYQYMSTASSDATLFVTVLCLTDGPRVTKAWLKDYIDRYRSNDDVFCEAFLGVIAFTGIETKEDLEITPDAQKHLDALGTKWIDVFSTKNLNVIPPPGPYLISGRHLLEVRRLYDDTHHAFMASLINGPNSYASLQLDMPMVLVSRAS